MDLQSELSSTLRFAKDETGVTVEWEVNNALFHNIIGWPIPNMVSDELNTYYWITRTGNVFSEFSMSGDNAGILYANEPIWNSILLPGSVDNFTIDEGKNLNDVVVKLISIELQEIESFKLLKSVIEPCDIPVHYTPCENSSPSQNLYLPQNMVIIFKDPHNSDDSKFSIISYHGQYNPETWCLRAVKSIKYHVSNATFISPYWYDSNVESIMMTNCCEPKEYFSMQGIKVQIPIKGHLYIEKTGLATKIVVFH